jgi:GT2 family glycosyltransferase
MIDVFFTTYLRQKFTEECLDYLRDRTTTPHRVIIIDNGGNEFTQDRPDVFMRVGLSQNIGIHAAWNLALSMAESEYFVTSDPDLLVPKLEDDWLSRMIKFMDERPDYGAISMMPHIFIGAVGIDPSDPEDVKERNMCGAVFRIMRTEAVRKVGGWEHKMEAGRNHEESTICSRLQAAGYKTGICSRVRAYHNFGENWGYPPEFTPEMQKHNPALKDYVLSFDNRNAYNQDTWMPL